MSAAERQWACFRVLPMVENACRALIYAALHLDLAGLEIDGEVIELVDELQDDLRAIAEGRMAPGAPDVVSVGTEWRERASA
jgi:hypothetical protein